MKEIYRQLQTPDGTILVSRHRHDYVTYVDKNGKEYMLDGGINSGYFRYNLNEDQVITTILSTDDFEIVRKYMYRWNNRQSKYISLENIEDDWLNNIIEYYLSIPQDSKRSEQISDEFLCLYIKEKQWRAELWEDV